MLSNLFLGSMIRGALGVRPKPHFGASRFLTGGVPGLGLGLNLGTLLGAAGLAWGAYEHLKDRDPSVMTTIEGGGFPVASAPPPIPRPPIPESGPPPLPSTAAATATAAQPYSPPTGPDALRRLVALTIAAARCDGELGEEEYGKILAAAREHGAEKLVQGELARRSSFAEIVAGANDPRFRSDLYALAYGIVRADASVSPAERKWLRELAAALGFDTEAAAKIEQETADRIDRHAQ
jgi:uncharacterized membrane protein YebE (DUF533 family)